MTNFLLSSEWTALIIWSVIMFIVALFLIVGVPIIFLQRKKDFNAWLVRQGMSDFKEMNGFIYSRRAGKWCKRGKRRTYKFSDIRLARVRASGKEAYSDFYWVCIETKLLDEPLIRIRCGSFRKSADELVSIIRTLSKSVNFYDDYEDINYVQ